MEDRDRFANLPNLETDNEIIDVVLSGLMQCRLKQCEPFILHRQTMDLSTVNRVASFMRIEKLVDYKVGDYDQDAFDYKLRLTEKGDFIANSGGWISHLEENTLESEWLDKIIYAAKNGVAEYHARRFSLEKYERAFQKLCRQNLVKPRSKTTYELLLDGEDAIELGGYANWVEHNEKQRVDSIHKTNSITIHGPVTGSVVNQDFLSGNVSNHNLTKPQNAIAASTPIKADKDTSSLNIWQHFYNWTNHNAISAIITAITIALFGLLMKWLGWM